MKILIWCGLLVLIVVWETLRFREQINTAGIQPQLAVITLMKPQPQNVAYKHAYHPGIKQLQIPNP